MLYFVYIILWTNDLYKSLCIMYCSQEQDAYVHNLQSACVYLHVYVAHCSLLSKYMVGTVSGKYSILNLYAKQHIHILNSTNLTFKVCTKQVGLYILLTLPSLHCHVTVMSLHVHVLTACLKRDSQMCLAVFPIQTGCSQHQQTKLQSRHDN